MVYIVFPLSLAAVASLCLWPVFGIVTPAYGLLVYPYVVLALPLLDLVLRPLSAPQDSLVTKPSHEWALALVLPMVAGLLLLGLWRLSQGAFSMTDALIIGASIGMVSGAIGMTAAHELIHRSEGYMRALGIGILVLVQYGHFRIEHIHGHHVHVGTDKDPASARFNEGFYAFFIRVVKDSYSSAWQIEARRLQNRKQALWGPANRMLHYLLLQIAIIGIAYFIAGGKGLMMLFMQTFVALILTEAVDYIQHYGLVRELNDKGRPEPVAAHHSWNSRHAAGDYTTFNIGLHSCHHAQAKTPYAELSQQESHHEMPANYAVMISMALLPPLWFRVMNKRVPQ